MDIGQSNQIGVVADFASQFGVDIISLSQFSSQNPAIATVSATGLVTGVADGTTTIDVFVEGEKKSVTVNVGDTVHNVDNFTAFAPFSEITSTGFKFDFFTGCTPHNLIGRFNVTNTTTSPLNVVVQAGTFTLVSADPLGTPALQANIPALAAGDTQSFTVHFPSNDVPNSFNSTVQVSCSGTEGTNNSVVTVDGTKLPPITMTPTTFTDTHTVGVTDCIDPIGTVTLKNNCEVSFTYTVIADSPVSAFPSSGTIVGNGTVQVPFFFDCSIAQSFTRNPEIRLTREPLPLQSPLQVSLFPEFQVTVITPP